MTLSLSEQKQIKMNNLKARFSSLILILTCFSAFESMAQTPDWMFALEGTYVGRIESIDADVSKSSDVRLDGLRNGSENGFVLQFAISTDDGIHERVEMWGWDAQNEQVKMTSLEDNKQVSSSWFVQNTGPQVVMSRGGSESGRAVLIQWRIQRLPGQLRMDRMINDGSGHWELRDRYVLDEAEIEE
jgi:hypothetical protein